VLDQYIRNYTHEVISETAGKTLNEKRTKILEDNVNHWMKNEINCGNISVLSKYISPARDNTSPLVRLINQKLEEVEQNVAAEVEEFASTLEALRVENRSSKNKFSLVNTLNKYCERDEDGLFTGNFVSPVNYGQYMNDLREERQFLIKKHKLALSDKQSILWDDNTEDQWKAYNIDLILWMAGAERDEAGNYAQTDENGNYKRDSNGNIILKGSKFDENGNVDLTKRPFEPRIHRRYTYQYYLDKVEILGRAGVEELSNINQQIANI